MKWCSHVKRILRTSAQPTLTGTTFYFEEQAVGRLIKLNFVVTEWIVNKSADFKMISGNLVKGCWLILNMGEA